MTHVSLNGNFGNGRLSTVSESSKTFNTFELQHVNQSQWAGLFSKVIFLKKKKRFSGSFIVMCIVVL